MLAASEQGLRFLMILMGFLVFLPYIERLVRTLNKVCVWFAKRIARLLTGGTSL